MRETKFFDLGHFPLLLVLVHNGNSIAWIEEQTNEKSGLENETLQMLEEVVKCRNLLVAET